MKRVHFLLMFGLALYFALFLLLPLYTVVAEGLRLSYLLEVFRTPVYREGLVNSLAMALVTTWLTLVLALPLALLNDRYDFTGKALVTPLLLLPLILPPFVGALGFLQVFGRFGALNSGLVALGLCDSGCGPDWLGGAGRFWAVCVVEALHLYPILCLNLMAALARTDPSLEEAARNLGCGRLRRLLVITLPAIRPGLFSGIILVLIWSFTELGAPLMLGYHRVTTVQIFNGITELETNPLPYALVVILLAFSCGLYAVGRGLFGGDAATTAGKGTGGGGNAFRPSGMACHLPLLPFLAVTMLAGLPHLGMALLAVAGDWHGTVLPSAYTLAHYRDALSHPLVVPSILNSLCFSVLAMGVGVGAGLVVALLTVRWRPPGWQIIDLLAMAPLAVPGMVLAFGYLSMSVRYDWIRAVMDPVRNPTLLLVMAYSMRRLPYVVRAVVAGLQQTPPELEDAARNLGAGAWRTLRRVTVPLVATNVIIGALFAFSFSMLEVSDSLILAQRAQYFPVTRAIFELSQILGSGPYTACAFGVWAMVFLGATLAAAAVIMGRNLSSLFRW